MDSVLLDVLSNFIYCIVLLPIILGIGFLVLFLEIASGIMSKYSRFDKDAE